MTHPNMFFVILSARNLCLKGQGQLPFVCENKIPDGIGHDKHAIGETFYNLPLMINQKSRLHFRRPQIFYVPKRLVHKHRFIPH